MKVFIVSLSSEMPVGLCARVSHFISWCCQLQEELCSDSVERIVVNPNAAYDKFKDKHVSTKGLGQYLMVDTAQATF